MYCVVSLPSQLFNSTHSGMGLTGVLTSSLKALTPSKPALRRYPNMRGREPNSLDTHMSIPTLGVTGDTARRVVAAGISKTGMGRDDITVRVLKVVGESFEVKKEKLKVYQLQK